jgi:tRNA modification GTPase
MKYSNSTICAIATAPGVGAIALIRISGDEAFTITDKVFRNVSGKKITRAAHASVLFGTILDEEDKPVDEVLIAVYKAPKSYTGENTAEISCHGSTYIQQKILQLLIRSGATPAQPGEFTQRAFLNGKMDLSQAEAVADLISSSSKSAHRLALHQMRGGFTQELVLLRSELLKFGSLIELELDFAEEEVEFADRHELKVLAQTIEIQIARLANSFELGNALKNGIPVAIVGETNVGKSTLLNTLLKEEKAIVSDIHGTTRDVIEDVITIRGIQFRLMDTAGIRKTTDTIENLGIERTYQQITKASVVLLLVDARQRTERINEMVETVRAQITDQKVIVVANKCDAISDNEAQLLASQLHLQTNEKLILISAKFNIRIDELESALLDIVAIEKLDQNEFIVTNARHYEALTQAHSSIQRVINGLHSGISGDFLAQDIRECMHYLGEISGQITTDDMLGYIFQHFCIGK